MSSNEDDSTFHRKKNDTSKTTNLEVCYHQPTASTSLSSNRQHIQDANIDSETNDNNSIEMLHVIRQCKEIPSADKIISRRRIHVKRSIRRLGSQIDKSSYLKYFCILCFPCIQCIPALHPWRPRRVLQPTSNRSRTVEIKSLQLNENVKLNMLMNDDRSIGKRVDKLASLLEQPTINRPNFEEVLNIALHTAVRSNDLISAYMLLCKGANASDPNVHNMTALHLATRNGNVDMVRLILMASQQPPDIDNYRDDNNRTTREVIQNELPELSLHSDFFEDLRIPPIKEQTLKFFLNNSDETKCLKVMKEGFDGELSVSVAEELLNIATRRNYCKFVQEILRRFIESPTRLNMIKDWAVLCGNHIILRELLKLQPDVTNDLILDACRLLGIPRETDNTFDRLECLKLILEQENVDVRCTNDMDYTPLQYALEANCYEAATLLLRQGSYLGHVNNSNNIVIADIPEFVLSSYFNDCIQLKEEWTDECTIEFDYRCFMPHHNFTEQHKAYWATREMEVFLHMANNGTLKHLLRHPLISSFLYIKWYRIRHVLYANLIFYLMFYFSVNSYVLSMTYDTSPNKSHGEQIVNNSSDTFLASTPKTITEQNIPYFQNNLLSVFAIGMLLTLFTIREILQFLFYPRRYLTDLENWSQVLLIVLTFALLCGAGLQIGVVVILLSTWELMTLISHHLFPSTCIEMLRTVCFNFVRFSFPHLFLILAFALAFYMLLRDGKGFSNPGFSLFKTIIMFTGEFDVNDTSFSTYPVWSRIVFMLFIFHIVIVLFNLLNGLAINNIAEILNKAEIIGLVSRIRLIAYFERMIVGKPFCWNSKWTWWNSFNFLTSKILLFPHYLRNGMMIFKPYDNLIVYDSDMNYVNGKSMDKRWSTLKMDSNIVKHAKQIIYDRNEPSNDDIMNELAKLQTILTKMKITLNCAEEDIF